MISVDALTVNPPTQIMTENLAAPSTLTLSHNAIDTHPEGAATYDAATDSITMTGIGYGRSLAYTDAPVALDGKNYVLTFTTQTKGWSNLWALTFEFAKDGDLTQSVSICDRYIAYTDAAGTVHQLDGTATNSAIATVKVFVRQEANHTCGMYIYLNGTLKGEFHKQQHLVPTLMIVGAQGASSWQPVVKDLAMYATGSMYGDVNGDGKISASDITALSRYLAHWDGYTAANIRLDNADMDQDGAVTPLDEVALGRYFASWLGYEAPYIPTIVVTDYGVDNTGTIDATDKLNALHATGKRIYYPNGTYLFNGKTLDFSGGVEFESNDGVTIRNSISNVNIVNFDEKGNLIGLMQNHLEYMYLTRGQEFTKTGSLLSPPISTANYETKVDVVPFWYNDYGRVFQTTEESTGTLSWYDWSWNHHNISDSPTVEFAHSGDAQNTGGWTISDITVYKPQGDDPTVKPDGATEYIRDNLVELQYGQFLKASTWADQDLYLECGGADKNSGTFTLSGLGYDDEYVIQFDTKMPGAWGDRPIYTITTGEGEEFQLFCAGLAYVGGDGAEQLSYAQSGLQSSNAATLRPIRYSLHIVPNGDGTRTVTVYADGQKMIRADGTSSASFTHDIPTESNYDPIRHPLLGWYFGDDATVLDWQAYWLREYGMDQSVLVADNISSDPKTESYWAYVLLNHAPNAKDMRFALQLVSSNYHTNYTEIKANWWDTFDQFYFNEAYKDQVYCYEQDGKKYPVVYILLEDAVRYCLSNKGNLVSLYKEVGQAFQDNGWDGVCIWARVPSLKNDATYLADLDANGVKWVATDYPFNGTKRNTAGYSAMVDNFDASTVTENTLFGVATSLHSKGHNSNWVCEGSTGAEFARWLKKAVSATNANANRMQTITCYNIAEWAEGGASLQPSVGDGFSYLQAVYDSIVK